MELGMMAKHSQAVSFIAILRRTHKSCMQNQVRVFRAITREADACTCLRAGCPYSTCLEPRRITTALHDWQHAPPASHGAHIAH